jgi:hypothetical protein
MSDAAQAPGPWQVFERKSKTSDNIVYLVWRYVYDTRGRRSTEYMANHAARTGTLRRRVSTFRSEAAALAAIAKATGAKVKAGGKANYRAGNALAVRNKARSIGAALGVLSTKAADMELLGPNARRLRTSTLDDYRANSEAAGVHIDAGLEPHLVRREALAMDMVPYVEVWDVHAESVKVGVGRRLLGKDAVIVSTPVGDALLPCDTLLVWR